MMTHSNTSLPYSSAGFHDSARALLLDYSDHKEELTSHWDEHVQLVEQNSEKWASGSTKKAKKLEIRMLDSISSKTVFYLLQMPFQRENGEFSRIKYSDAIPEIMKVDPRQHSGEYVLRRVS